jgi:hypothetical protein
MKRKTSSSPKTLFQKVSSEPSLNLFKRFCSKMGPNPGMAVVLAMSTTLLYWSVLTGWWRWDDTQILKLAFMYSPGNYFFVPEAYQGLSLKNFTPWLIFSFDLDLNLFGFHPALFYLHQLILIWVTSLSAFALLRLWLPTLWAGLGALLCLMGSPVESIAQQLMTRHYIAGLLFSLLALYLYIKAVREDRKSLSLYAAFLYLIAMSAKEVYVPLVMICLFWPEESFRRRLTTALPFFISLTAYLIWRTYMVGAVGGGYPLDWNVILYVPASVTKALFGDLKTGVAIGILVACILAAGFYRKSLKTLLFSLVLTASVLGPLIPLGGSVNAGRYLLVAWWSLVMVLCTILGQWNLKKRWHTILPYGLFALIALSALMNSYRETRRLNHMAKPFDVVGQFLWGLDHYKEVPLYSSEMSLYSHYVEGLLWLKQKLDKFSPPVMIIGDEIELISFGQSRKNIWAYSTECHCVRDISGEVHGILKKWEERLRVRPLSIKLTYRNDKVVVWECGPCKNGTYTFISCENRAGGSSCETKGMSRFPLSSSGQWRVNLSHPLFFYLRYDSPEGWTTYSPLLCFDPNAHMPFVWSRW